MTSSKDKTIKVTTQTYEYLKRQGGYGDTMDVIIRKMIDVYEKRLLSTHQRGKLQGGKLEGGKL